MMKSAARIVTVAAIAAALTGGVQAAGAATGSTASHSATAQCGQGRITVSASMQQVQSVVAGPVTAAGQHVAQRAILYRWVNQRWEQAATGAWLWGYVTGGATTSTFRSYETNQPQTAQFTVATGQYYSVVVEYYWYANSDVGSGQTSAVAQHVDMGGPSNGFCKA